MKQVITDLNSGEVVDTLNFQWDTNWRPKDGPDPFKPLSDFVITRKGNWDELCIALAELMTVNGQKISGATLGARLNGEWIYLGQIVDGVMEDAMRYVKGKIK